MVFLDSHGVGTARAVRIYKTYGPDAIRVMTENPSRPARDIRGIGFKAADAIAMKLGIDRAPPCGSALGISYALTEAMDEGHCGLPTEELIPLAEEVARGSAGADQHCARTRAAGGHGGRRPSCRNSLCISGRLASGGAHHRRAADPLGERHAALALESIRTRPYRGSRGVSVPPLPKARPPRSGSH